MDSEVVPDVVTETSFVWLPDRLEVRELVCEGGVGDVVTDWVCMPERVRLSLLRVAVVDAV